MDKVGIVTVTYNSEKVIAPFIRCVLNQEYSNFILYIIDNASMDNSVSIISEENDKRIKIIINDKNEGVAKANNQGIKKAILDECSQILLVNNDVEFDKNLLKKLIYIQAEKGYSLVTPKMMYFDLPDNIWYAGSWFLRSKGYIPLHRGIEENDNGQYDRPCEVEYAPTCCLLINKKVFHDIGLMDEKFFVYFDDTDFLYRIWQDKRHFLYYFPSEIVYHKVGSLTKSLYRKSNQVYRGDFFLKQMTRNHVYFLKKKNTFFSFFYILWLFFKNNLKFIFSSRIKKNIRTLILINTAYFEGLRM